MNHDSQKQFLAKVDFCQAHQLLGQVWRVASDLEAFDSPSYKEHVKALNVRKATAALAYQNAGGLLIDTTITGWGDGVDYYALDEALRAKFGNQITLDSELGGFFAYIPRSMESEVTDFIKSRHSQLTYSISAMDEVEFPGVGNWPRAKSFLQHQHIALETQAFIDVRPIRTGLEIEELIEEAADVLVKTGLTLEQVLSHVNDELKNRGL